MKDLTPTKNRDIVFDALKFFAIFMVLWGHAIQHLSSTPQFYQPLYRIIYSFHMPLFMTIVGYFSVSNKELSITKLLIKKARQLLLPAFVFGIVLCIPNYYKEGLKSAFHMWFYIFWFLKSAFCCAGLYFIGKSFIKQPIILFVITLLFSQVIYIFGINVMYPCFLFGIILNKNVAIIREYAPVISLISGIIFFTMLLFYDADFWLFPHKTMNIGIQETLESYYFIGYRIVIGLFGTLFFISLFMYIIKKFSLPDYVRHLISFGQETLGIYLLQTILLEISLPKILNLDTLNFPLFNFVATPLISLVILIACLGIINLIKKSPFLSLIFLGKKKN